MFNSVAQYLWGATETPVETTEPLVEEIELDVTQDDDWLVVDTDKENCENQGAIYCPSLTCHREFRHHPHHEVSEPIAIPMSHCQYNDLDYLDEASSLDKTLTNDCPLNEHYQDDQLSHRAMQDRTVNLNNTDVESNFSEISDAESYENIRPSSPESVFSMCSGRSHGTYKPHGISSQDSWVIAPPPCFIGSQVDSSSTLESSSSLLENLLIEHPSVSVYYSFPPSSLSPSHPFHSNLLAGNSGNNSQQSSHVEFRRPDDQAEGSTVQSVNSRRREVQERQVPRALLNSEQVAAKLHSAQKNQRKKSGKSLARITLQRENKVYDKSWVKSCSGHNKRVRPSGCKAGRVCQRV